MKRISAIFLLSFLVACAYDKLDIQKDTSCLKGAPDSFSQEVNPIIQSNCVSCHNPGAGIDLSSYVKVKPFADGGGLSGVINGRPDFFAMPPDHPMDSCSVYIVQRWIDEGALNN